MRSDLATLSILPATQEQVLESRRRSYVQWGKGVTLEQYLARDEILETSEHAKDGRLTTWVLVSRDDPQSLGFKCSCETYERIGIVSRSNSLPSEVACYGIASVFTPEANRGKGYARHMMRLLHWVLAPPENLPKEFPLEWGAPPTTLKCNASFSTLWSDVGAFYESCGPTAKAEGWITRDPYSTVWEINPEEISNDVAGTGWQFLSAEEVDDLWPDETARLKTEFSNGSKGLSTSISFAYLPDRGVEAFQRRRRMVGAPGWESLKTPVDKWGVKLPTGDACTAWTIDWKPLTLLVTHLRVEARDFGDLFTTIKLIAVGYGITRIEAWNIPEELRKSAVDSGGVEFLREEHLPSFKWYGPEEGKDVSWLYNERYCWC